MASQSQSEFFELGQQTWADAMTAAGETVDRWYEIAGLTVHLHFAGVALVPLLTPALAHLERSPLAAAPDLTVRLWDCSSTGVALPTAPCPLEDFTVRGELRGFHDGRFYAAYEGLGRSICLFDAIQKSAVVGVFDGRGIPTFERAAPFRPLLGWLMRHHNRQLVHAASVGTVDGAVLIVGRGGAGKSNTAVGSLIAGLSYAGDDFCAVTADPIPKVHSLYSTAKLRPGDWARLPFAHSNPGDPPTEKRLYHLLPHFADRIVRDMPIRAVVMPAKGQSGDPTFKPVTPSVPLFEMVSQSMGLLPNSGGEVLSTLSNVVRRVPCFRFELGSRPERIPAAISDLLRTLSPQAATLGAAP